MLSVAIHPGNLLVNKEKTFNNFTLESVRAWYMNNNSYLTIHSGNNLGEVRRRGVAIIDPCYLVVV